jgi:hypothetical protein
VIRVECPECSETFEIGSDTVFLFNRFHCSVCDALLEVIEEDPLVLVVIDEEYLDSEDEEEEDDWTDE